MSSTNILGLLGGLALFLYGMQMMSNGLESVAGNKMKDILSGGSADRTGHPLAVLPLTDVAYSLRVNILLTSQVWNFAPPAQNYARSRGAVLFVKKASAFFDSL